MDKYDYLLSVTRDGNLEEVKAIIEKEGIQLTYQGKTYTVLHTACRSGHIDICKYLVDMGALISLSNKEKKGWSPLEFAMGKNSKPLIQCFTEKELVEGNCSVCEEVGILFPLSCGHTQVCIKCLKKWMTELVKQRKDIICPQKECLQTLLERDAFYILPKRIYNLYVLQQIQCLIAKRKDEFHWCPQCPSGGWITTQCPILSCPDCNTEFCSTCGVPTIHHQEIDCVSAKMTWDTELWKKTNTKPCPQCSSPIEKTGGCSHMVCKICKFEFCWLCLKKFNGKRTFGNNCPCG